MEGLSDMTLDKFKLWSSNALKVYLSSRKKNVDGTFEELAARYMYMYIYVLNLNDCCAFRVLVNLFQGYQSYFT